MWCGGCWNGEGRHAVWRCRPSGFVVLWRCPTLPQPIDCSTIGAAGLSFQVRNGAGRFPGAVTTTRISVQHAPHHLVVGCGLIVVCIVVAACVACIVSPLITCLGCLFSVGPLVPVGSRAPRGASTSGLSTRSSGGGLSPHKWGRGNLILEQASRLDAFSGYPFRT